MGTEKNCLNEMVLLSTQNMFRRLVENNHKFKLRSVVVQWKSAGLKIKGLQV